MTQFHKRPDGSVNVDITDAKGRKISSIAFRAKSEAARKAKSIDFCTTIEEAGGTVCAIRISKWETVVEYIKPEVEQ